MSAPKDFGDAHPAHLIDSDIDFVGYDPYIVAITGGGGAAGPGNDAGDADPATESRKVKLMSWLREHGS
ncbi:MAG: hypothetical protein E4H19_10305 [Chromatiales bacterium]|jgi:hypothetical protein|nr:MAG: hypothetical protein E4H19_10305 [Chromatiales bacterium]